MVLLNGRKVEKVSIDPMIHKYIGSFREPHPPDSGSASLICDCGEVLHTKGEPFEHWQKGHFDYPQYVDIKEAI